MEATTGSNRFGSDHPVVHRVLEAVARTEGCEVVELPPLSETVDPDALDAVADCASVTHITFPYHGYQVSIRETGHVDVRPTGD